MYTDTFEGLTARRVIDEEATHSEVSNAIRGTLEGRALDDGVEAPSRQLARNPDAEQLSGERMTSRGSEWHRWEPHIHAPSTTLNNQFGAVDPWGAYLTSLENVTPKIEAIAVTDYYVTDTYEEFLSHQAAGRLPNVTLLFPNIELRLDVAAKSGFVNIHLLISPEDPDHLSEVKRILKRLQFHAFDDRFDCTREELIKLGKRADREIADDGVALRHGATQFKVNFDQLRKVIDESDWAKNNILIAVAGGTGDGTSGVRQASDTTVRQEIEKFAHIIFSSSPAQREFWIGQRGATVEDLRTRYDGCKPCLHGSDAHDQQSVGQSVDNRFSWIKGDLVFDALRQACIDPEGRAFVGEQSPSSATPSQVISHVKIGNADWASTPDIPLNPGLVAIIGARGSGKTALVEVIAAGCDATTSGGWDADLNISPSFLSRVRRLIGDATTTVTWGGGEMTTRSLDGSDANGHMSFPRARYLSQQFVEELCSAKGVSDGLVDEIERVIFESHSHDDREWALDFAELREQHTARFQQAREREAEAISDISDRIATEFEKESFVATLTKQVAQKQKLIADYTADRAKLVVKGTETQMARHTELSQAAQKLRNKIQAFGNRRRSFVALQDEVRSMRATGAPEMLRQAQTRHVNSGLNAKQWDKFLLIYKGDVDKSLAAYIAWADGEVGKLNGSPPPTGDPNVALIPNDADLSTLPLAPIAAEMTRLEALFSADKLVREQYAALTRRIAQENSALQTFEKRLTDAQGAAARRKDLEKERDDTYGRVWRMRAMDCGSRTGGRAALPLADARVAERDVLAWWKGQPFDLGLSGYAGNCACCFLKGRGKLLHIIREDPSLADWWIEQEARVANRAGPDGRACESMKRFRIGETYAELKAAALSRRDLFDTADEDEDDTASDCICTD